jgi:hypothetical protein
MLKWPGAGPSGGQFLSSALPALAKHSERSLPALAWQLRLFAGAVPSASQCEPGAAPQAAVARRLAVL